MPVRVGVAPELRQILPGIDTEPEPVQRDRFHQRALDTGVDLEAGGRWDGSVIGIEYRVNLGQRDPLDGDRDLDEVPGLGLEVRQPVEATDLPARSRVSESQLLYSKRPAEVAELALSSRRARRRGCCSASENSFP